MSSTEFYTCLSPEELMRHHISMAKNYEDFKKEVENDTNYTRRLMMEQSGGRVESVLRRWKGMQFVSWDMFSGAQILDLASGSQKTTYFPPIFARCCSVNGALVTAFDINYQIEPDGRLFTEVRTEIFSLIEDETLITHPAIQGKTFDIIHSSNFFSRNPDPNRYSHYFRKTKKRFHTTEKIEDVIRKQCVPILKDGGIIDLDEYDETHNSMVFYRKINGELHKETAPKYL